MAIRRGPNTKGQHGGYIGGAEESEPETATEQGDAGMRNDRDQTEEKSELMRALEKAIDADRLQRLLDEAIECRDNVRREFVAAIDAYHATGQRDSKLALATIRWGEVDEKAAALVHRTTARLRAAERKADEALAAVEYGKLMRTGRRGR